MIALLELAVHAHSFCAWYWFNKRIVFIVRVYRGVDVFDHRISNYSYCFLLSIVFLIFVCWPSNCLYGSIIFAFMFVEGSASETIALSLYMRGTAIFSYLLMIFDLIAKNSKKACFSLISLRSKIYLEIKFGIKDRGRGRGLKN